MSAAGIHYDHPSFDVFSETTAVNRCFLSGARLHHDHPSSVLVAESLKRTGNRQQHKTAASSVRNRNFMSAAGIHYDKGHTFQVWPSHYIKKRFYSNIPAATVSFVASSIRITLPVIRFTL